MDLRSLPPDLDAEGRCNKRRRRVEEELGISLPHIAARREVIGSADERNCEQMLGCVSVPVGYAGPLPVTFSSGETKKIHLPLATTEGALVASVNRGCKALRESKGVRASSQYHGISRSLAFHVRDGVQMFTKLLKQNQASWQKEAESTSNHLKLLHYDIDIRESYVFLTLSYDTDEAMGMNMATIASEAIGTWVEQNVKNTKFLTVAANVDSDKKPSARTKERGRGYRVTAEAEIDERTIREVLKTSKENFLEVAKAKIEMGSEIAGALGKNLHASNIISALFIATGQDPAHTVEGSLTDTIVTENGDGIVIRVSLPAILIGVRGGGTSLPSQNDCLRLLLHEKSSLPPIRQLAESIGAAVLAGELSLLAAQASHTLSSAHAQLGRSKKSTE